MVWLKFALLPSAQFLTKYLEKHNLNFSLHVCKFYNIPIYNIPLFIIFLVPKIILANIVHNVYVLAKIFDMGVKYQ